MIKTYITPMDFTVESGEEDWGITLNPDGTLQLDIGVDYDIAYSWEGRVYIDREISLDREQTGELIASLQAWLEQLTHGV